MAATEPIRISRRQVLGAAAAIVAMPSAAEVPPGPSIGKIVRLDPALDRWIDPAATIERVMTGFGWVEGPLWVGGRGGSLFASDTQANLIRTFSPQRGVAVWLRSAGYQGTDLGRFREAGAAGLFLGRGGLLLANGGEREITRVDFRTKARTTLVDRFEGKRFNSPNDLVVSPRDGSIFFTDPPWGLLGVSDSPDREMDYTGVFRIATDGRVTLVGKYNLPNGIGISPDGGTLYHTDGTIGWVAHTIDASGKPVSERPFVDLAAEQMRPGADSLKVDRDGNLWTTSRDGISIITPAGKRLGYIKIPGRLANCEIGADGYLYIANDHDVVRVRVKARKLPVPARF